MDPIRRIYGILTAAERRRTLGLLVLILVGTVVEALSVGLVLPALVILVQPEFATDYPGVWSALRSLGAQTRLQVVVAGVTVLVAIYLVKTLYLAYLAHRQMAFAFDVQIELSQRLFRTYLKQPYTFHLQRNSAGLILNVQNEVNLFTFSAMVPAMLLLTEATVIVGIGSVLLLLEPAGMLLTVCLLGGAAWMFNRALKQRIDLASVTRQQHEGLKLQHLQQALGGAKELKLLGREDEFVREYKTHNVHAARSGQLQQTLQLLPRLLLEFMAVIALAVLILNSLLRGGSIDATVTIMALFGAAAFRLMPSVNRVVNSLQALRYSGPLLATLSTELALTVPDEPGPSRQLKFERELSLQAVTYRYPGSAEPALRNVSLTIAKGEVIGFIGRSGAGKSTLVDVILGLLPPETGSIEVDGHDLRLSMRAWQSQIGYVPQSIYLTDDSLRRNIAFGLPPGQVDDEAVQRAIRMAQLEEFVASLPQGTGTRVGERGVCLSGGQRQRIGIARALYHDPAVVLLDEATSALDTQTEAGLLNSVLALRGAKTVLIVAHRLSTVERCDRLYRLEGGVIAASGRTVETLRT